MTTDSARDRSHESIINDALARFLRERCGLSSVAETLHDGRRPDIIVRLSSGPVVLEIEIEPAPTVEADALSRLGMELDGSRVQNVFAVRVPERLRTTGQEHLYERMATAALVWQEWRIDGTSGPRQSGSATEFGSAVASTTPPAGDLDEAVDALDRGARLAGSRLYSSPGTLARVARVFGADPTDEAANMAALVVINAMVFQERLANKEAAFQPVSASLRPEGFSRNLLLQTWDYILGIDYYPIFSMARSVVSELSEVEAAEVLSECARTAATLLGMGAVGRHDLAGRIFNRLISERKLLAAFYTSIPASTLLAGLALSPDRWDGVDWSDAEAISKLSVVDPACGTGTLLMAAYRQIVQNHTAATPAGSDNPFLHKALVEKVIIGADVVQAAIHLTAATLAAMSPSVRFDQMLLHTFRLGMDADRKVWLGSLEWLEAPEIQSFFSSTEEQIGAISNTGSIVQRPAADLVISNPPFTRRGSDGGKEEAISRVFSLPEGDPKSLDAIKKRTSALLKGTAANQIAGHGSSFAVLADRLVNRGGRIAMVLPVTALFGESWRDVRRMPDRYEIEFVVSSHDPALRSMSYDTKIAEALLVARRLREDEQSGRGRFVNPGESWSDDGPRMLSDRYESLAPRVRGIVPPVGPRSTLNVLRHRNAAPTGPQAWENEQPPLRTRQVRQPVARSWNDIHRCGPGDGRPCPGPGGECGVRASTPLLRSDGPPELALGGRRWLVGSSGANAWRVRLGEDSWTSARWKRAVSGWSWRGGEVSLHQPLSGVRFGRRTAARLRGAFQLRPWNRSAKVGPQDRRIHGSIGVFDAYHGWNFRAQFPGERLQIWKHREAMHQSVAHTRQVGSKAGCKTPGLFPKPERDV